MKLLIGSGATRRDGWLTLNGNPAHGADIVAMLPPLPAEVRNRQWEEIEWIHGIASLYPWDAAVVLRELRGVLVPDGVLVLEQPDARKLAGHVRWMYGDPDPCDALNMCHWAYTPDSLREALAAAGFTRIDEQSAIYHYPPRDFRIVARP